MTRIHPYTPHLASIGIDVCYVQRHMCKWESELNTSVSSNAIIATLNRMHSACKIVSEHKHIGNNFIDS